MVKKGQKTSKKKGEFFFNFNQLRRKLNTKQKEKLIKFFGNFRLMFLNVKQHLSQVNKMYDLMEQEFKKFQKDLFKNDEYLSGGNQNDNIKSDSEEFVIDDDIMKQILEEDLKNEKGKIDNKKDNKELIAKYETDISKKCKKKEKEKINIDKDIFSKENENQKK